MDPPQAAAPAALPLEAKRELLDALSLVPDAGVYGVQVCAVLFLGAALRGSINGCAPLMPIGMRLHSCIGNLHLLCSHHWQEEERQRILRLVEALEAGNPLHAPTEHLDCVEGTWRLLFSTITILVCSCSLPPHWAACPADAAAAGLRCCALMCLPCREGGE